MTDIDFADDFALLANTVKNAEKQLNHSDFASREVGFDINAKKTEYMSVNIYIFI